MRDGEPQIYAALATMRNGYMQTQWQRVQMLLTFNTVAFPLVFGVIQVEGTLKVIVSIVGLLVHVIIMQGVSRATSWIGFLDERLIELETLDDESDSGIRVRAFSHPKFGQARNHVFASRRLFVPFGLGVTCFWFGYCVFLVSRAMF